MVCAVLYRLLSSLATLCLQRRHLCICLPCQIRVSPPRLHIAIELVTISYGVICAPLEAVDLTEYQKVFSLARFVLVLFFFPHPN